MQHVVSLGSWVRLPNEVRYRIRALFNIPRTGHIVVSDQVLETDGTTYEDFKALTVEKMQSYLDETSDNFYQLFDMVIAKVTEDILNPKGTTTVIPVSGGGVNIIIEPKKPGKTKKK